MTERPQLFRRRKNWCLCEIFRTILTSQRILLWVLASGDGIQGSERRLVSLNLQAHWFWPTSVVCTSQCKPLKAGPFTLPRRSRSAAVFDFCDVFRSFLCIFGGKDRQRSRWLAVARLQSSQDSFDDARRNDGDGLEDQRQVQPK